MNELALFAGAGGGVLGGVLLGWNTVAAVELEEYPRNVLLQRQRDGMLPDFPVWDDVCTFDGKPWRGLVDVVSGGFPCQDISSAGKGAGIEGSRSGLWKEMLRIIREVRPRYAFMENSPMLTSRGLGTVLGDLAEAGYDAEWLVLGAADVGAPHRRDRIWLLAEDAQRGEFFSHSDLQGIGRGEQQQACSAKACGAQCMAEYADLHDVREEQAVPRCEHVANSERIREALGEYAAAFDTDSDGLQCAEQGEQHEGAEELAGGCTHGVEARHDVVDTDSNGGAALCTLAGGECETLGEAPTLEPKRAVGSTRPGGRGDVASWWEAEPDVGRVADGVAARVDRLKAIGNGQVPLVAATAFLELQRRLSTASMLAYKMGE